MSSKDYDAFKDVLDEIDALKQDLTSGKRRELRGVDKVGKRMDLSRFNAAFATLRSRLPDESILAQYDSELRQVSRENATLGNLEKMESLIDSLQKSIGMAWITSDLSDTEYQELLGILSSKNVIDKVVLLNQGIDVHLTKAQANRLRALRIVRAVRGKPALEERGRILAKLASNKKPSVLMGARVSRPRSANSTTRKQKEAAKKGLLAEKRVARWLIDRGWTHVHYHRRHHAGPFDIDCKKKGESWLIEVKTGEKPPVKIANLVRMLEAKRDDRVDKAALIFAPSNVRKPLLMFVMDKPKYVALKASIKRAGSEAATKAWRTRRRSQT
jgi:Holliday junction resolvase-like predicted endonuclease